MELSLTEIAQRLTLPDTLDDVPPLSAHVGADGRAMVVCELWSDNPDPYEGLAAIVLDGDEASLTRVPAEMALAQRAVLGIAAFEDGLVFLSRRYHPAGGETIAAFLPRKGMEWGEIQPLQVTPDLPIRMTSKGYEKPVMPGHKAVGRDGMIAWPVGAATGSPDTSVKSVIFVQPSLSDGRLDWSYWPQPSQAKSLLGRLFGGNKPAGTPSDFVQPDPDSFPAFNHDVNRMPNILSAVFDGDQLLMTSDGATEVKKYGDRCAAISEIGPDGRVSHLYLENFIAADRPDASQHHDYQTRFVDGGNKVLLKSRYKSTDPWKGGFALFNVAEQRLMACSGPKSPHYYGPLEIVGEHALYVEFKGKTDKHDGRLSIRREKITFA